MKYKNTLLAKSLLLGAVALFFVQCNEADDKLETGGDIVITDSIPTTGVYNVEATDLVVTPNFRQLEVSWKAPVNEKPAFYQVEWQGVTDDRTLYTLSVNGTEATLDNLYNTEYKVTVKAVSGEFLKSKGISTTATPTADLEAPANISDLKISPMVNRVNFVWTNPEDEDFDHIIFKVKEAGVDTFLYNVNLLGITEALAFGQLKEKTEYTCTIQTFDYIGNASEELTETFRTKTEQFLQKVGDDGEPLWSIAGFSSEETGEEEPTLAANAIDGNEDTFWHSVWSGGNFAPGVSTGKCPQYIIVDLKNEYTLSGVLLYQRKGYRNGPTSAQVEVTSGNPESTRTEWTDLGTTRNMGGESTDGAQSCVLNQVVSARYVKITILSTADPDSFVRLREIDFKVLVDE